MEGLNLDNQHEHMNITACFSFPCGETWEISSSNFEMDIIITYSDTEFIPLM